MEIHIIMVIIIGDSQKENYYRYFSLPLKEFIISHKEYIKKGIKKSEINKFDSIIKALETFKDIPDTITTTVDVSKYQFIQEDFSSLELHTAIYQTHLLLEKGNYGRYHKRLILIETSKYGHELIILPRLDGNLVRAFHCIKDFNLLMQDHLDKLNKANDRLNEYIKSPEFDEVREYYINAELVKAL